MLPLDLIAIELNARQLRAEELRRISGVMSARIGLYLHLLAGTASSGLVMLGNLLRPLFSWNPQSHHPI